MISSGAKVYVTGESDSSVTVLDALTGRRLGVVHVAKRPRFMTFAPHGDWATREHGGGWHGSRRRMFGVIAFSRTL